MAAIFRRLCAHSPGGGGRGVSSGDADAGSIHVLAHADGGVGEVTSGSTSMTLGSDNAALFQCNKQDPQQGGRGDGEGLVRSLTGLDVVGEDLERVAIF